MCLFTCQSPSTQRSLRPIFRPRRHRPQCRKYVLVVPATSFDSANSHPEFGSARLTMDRTLVPSYLPALSLSLSRVCAVVCAGVHSQYLNFPPLGTVLLHLLIFLRRDTTGTWGTRGAHGPWGTLGNQESPGRMVGRQPRRGGSHTGCRPATIATPWSSGHGTIGHLGPDVLRPRPYIVRQVSLDC